MAMATPKLNLRVFPSTLYVPQVCPVTKTILLGLENASFDQISVPWVGATTVPLDEDCVGDLTPKAQAWSLDPGERQLVPVNLAFISNCSGTTRVRFYAYIQGDPFDDDTAFLEVRCNETNIALAHACDLSASVSPTWGGDDCCVEGVATQAECEGAAPDGLEGTWGVAGSSCDADTACQLPCNEPDCIETTAIPTVSKWGLVALVPLVLIVGALVLVTRLRARSG